MGHSRGCIISISAERRTEQLEETVSIKTLTRYLDERPYFQNFSSDTPYIAKVLVLGSRQLEQKVYWMVLVLPVPANWKGLLYGFVWPWAVGHSWICIQISTQRNSVWINSNKICAWERPRPGTVFKIRFLFSKT